MKDSNQVLTPLRLVIASSLLGGALLLPSPRLLSAQEDRCPGMTLPVCKSTEACAGVPYNTICTTNFYYFPNPE